MAFSLTWLPAVLRAAGLTVIEVESWQNRGHGDFGPAKGVMLHHTAGALHALVPGLLKLLSSGRPGLSGPLCNLGLEEDGTYYMIAAGRSYHAGGGAWQGVVDMGNTWFVGIEAANTGLPGDAWEDAQMDAYRRGVAAILRHIGAPATMACGHKEYARPLGRKTDPDFDMDAFRASLAPYLTEEKVA